MNCKWGKGHDILKCEMGGKKEGEEDLWAKSQTG